MPDLLILTGSDAASAVADKSRLEISEMAIDFIIKPYHNRASTRVY